MIVLVKLDGEGVMVVLRVTLSWKWREVFTEYLF